MNEFNFSKFTNWFNYTYYFNNDKEKWCSHSICSQINSFIEKFPLTKKLNTIVALILAYIQPEWVETYFYLHLSNPSLSAQLTKMILRSKILVRRQQHEPINYCFKITEHLSIQVVDFVSMSSLAHVYSSFS